MSKRAKKTARRVGSKATRKSSKKAAKKPAKKAARASAVKRGGTRRTAGRTASWPFSDPPNFATITVWRVLDRKDPILLVSRDAEDGMWQFLNTAAGQKPDIKDAAVVGLRDILMLDPSVGELADLPRGGMAWRTAQTRPWKRTPRK